MKKFGLSILIIILAVIILFYGYSFFVKIEFEKYLDEKYPDKTFEVNFPNYSLIQYNSIVIGDYFNTSVYCVTDDTRFIMTRNKGNINDKYLMIRNKTILNDTIFSYLKDEGFDKYVYNLNSVERKQIDLNTKAPIDVNNSIEGVSINYSQSIKDNIKFAKLSQNIIEVLKAKGLNFDAIYFISDRKDGVYDLRLKGDEINKTSSELLSMIRRRK